MPIPIRCPFCRSTFSAHERQRGLNVSCSHCRKAVRVPGGPQPKPAPKPQAQAAGSIDVRCTSCRSVCRVAAGNRGKRVICPQCKKQIGVPAAAASVPAAQQITTPAAAGAAAQRPRQQGIQSKSTRPALARSVGIGATARKKSKGIPAGLLIGGGIAAVIALFIFVPVVVVAAWFLWPNSNASTADTAIAQKSKAAKGTDQTPKGQAPGIKTPEKKKRPPLPDRISKKTVARVKEATVFIRVRMANGRMGEGSGFFGIEKGLVLTNAHVVGMLKSRRKPRSVEVVYKSGTKSERRMNGTVLGVDPSSDLAVLRVNAANLPEPLEIAPRSELFETQPVAIFGFPLGSQLAQGSKLHITVSPTTIASLRLDESGAYLKQVQVNGGMAPGNSGGPVVDTLGDIVGVAVSGYLGTSVNFAVPGEFVLTILNGRIQEMGQRPTKNADGTITVGVTMKTIDPLNRMREVGLISWIGNPGKNRKPTDVEPVPDPGDSPYKTVRMQLNGDIGKGTYTLDPLPAGKAYWVRPYFVDAGGKKKWVVAQMYRPIIGGTGGPGSGTLVVNLNRVLGPGASVDSRGRFFVIHSIRMESGRTYRIDLMSTQFDTFLGLINQRANVAITNDDGGDRLNSRIIHRCRISGLYNIVVTTFQSGDTGQYQLQVRRL